MTDLRGAIRSAFAQRPLVEGDGGLIVASPRDSIRLGEVMAPPTAWTGARPCIWLSDPIALIRTLLMLDGLCDAMLLAPPGLSADQILRLCATVGVSGIITDRPDAPQFEPAVEPQKAPAPKATQWILATSGTTGAPRPIHHDLTSLTRTVRRAATASDARWASLYDPFRFAGLQVMFQALLNGAPLLLPDTTEPLAERIGWLLAQGCTHLSATPALWRRLLMSPDAASLPLRQITLGGEIADDRLLAGLAARWPGASVTHIYASTDFGVSFSVQDGRAGFPARYLDEPTPAGIRHAIRDGMLCVFRDGEWHSTGDRVSRKGDRVYFLGREGAVVKVGGAAIDIEAIEAVVRGHALVADCQVRMRPSAMMGQLMTLSVVPQPNMVERAAISRSIRQWCASHLPAAARPATIEVVDEISLNAAGKIDRLPV